MQRLSLFRALLIFGFYKVRLTPVTGCCRLLISISQHGRSRLFRKPLWRDGYISLVALLMTLCNKSFSATQFALSQRFLL